MRRSLILAFVLSCGMSATLLANNPGETVVRSERVLSELMAIPAKQIPRRLMHEAQGIVIVPDVIKIGFVAGARRGHGVALVRDADGEWSLPQFVTLTGGSVGWQAGVEGTDVVLVFATRKGVESLMRGKFTVGVDASATAGPVGREAAIGTDATLRSEILSYSRSRGLFVGVALDGTSLEVDHEAHVAYYGSPTGAVPRRVPGSATELRHFLSEVTPHHSAMHSSTESLTPMVSPRLIESLRQSLNQSSEHLQVQLSSEWRPYLAIPVELQGPGNYPTYESMEHVLHHFEHVAKSDDYHELAKLPEFQRTYELMKEYERAVMSTNPRLKLPPPPTSASRN